MNRTEYHALVFDGFARAASLNVDLTKLDQTNEPDIRCSVSGETVGYELTVVTDGKFEKVAKHGPNGGVEWFQTDVVCAAFAKVWRRYRYDLPAELIVHEGPVPLLPASTWKDDLRSMLRVHFEGCGFRRVWVINPWKPDILYRWPP